MSQVITETPTTPAIIGQKIASPKISYEEFLRQYEGQYAEFVNGEVIENMSVTKTHIRLTKFFMRILESFAEIKNAGECFGEPYQMKMRFGDEIKGREPDIFFVKTENFDKLNEKFFEGGADLVIEIVSPESIYRDTQDKFEEYEAAGVQEYWLIDYTRRTANFYGFDENGKYKLLTISAEGKFESLVLDGLWVDTNWLWQENLPTLMEVLNAWRLA